MNKSLMDRLVTERDRRKAQLEALERVIELNRPNTEPGPMSAEHRQAISAGVRRAARHRTKVSVEERKEAVLAALKANGPLTLPDIRKRIGHLESATRTAVNALILEGTVQQSEERVGHAHAYLYSLVQAAPVPQGAAL